MSDAAVVRNTVLAVLSEYGPLDRAGIEARSDAIDNTKQLASALHKLKQVGHISNVRHGVYDITEEGRAAMQGLDFFVDTTGKVSVQLSPTEPRPSAGSAPRGTEVLSPTWPAPPRQEIDPLIESLAERHPETLGESLLRAAETAQNALDEYVYSVGNPTILDSLRDARDLARAALNTYMEGAKA